MSDGLRERVVASLGDGGERPFVDRAEGRVGAISYRETAAWLRGFDRRLAANGRRPRVVGILGNHRVEAYLSLLYAWLRGITFVPLNPALPPERLRRIAELAAIELLLHDDSGGELAAAIGPPRIDVSDHLDAGAARPPAGKAVDEWEPPGDGIAYHLFTSGSTGEPKGVPISRANLAAYVDGITGLIDFPRHARYSQTFDLAFDLAMHDVFVTLARGGTLVPPSAIDLMMPAGYIAGKQLDVWFSVPILAQQACAGFAAKRHRPRLKLALFCGEALPAAYAANFAVFLEQGAPLYNLYGPTEATIAFTAQRVDPADQIATPDVPIGLAFGANRLALDGEAGITDRFAHGDSGELLLGGPQVFAGYRPAVDQPVFETFRGERYYRSGDRVRFQDGGFYHLGRLDDQFKIRGHRVELGDIEAACRAALGIDLLAAFTRGEHGNKQICLAYVAAQPVDPSAIDLPLPEYMVPRQWRRVDSLPLNRNGKVDRRALREQVDDLP